MLGFDLIQDLFIETLSPDTMGLERADFYIYNKIKEAGYKDGIGLPLLLKKKIAEEAIQKTLKIHPFNPKSNYEMALVYLEMGDKEKALKHLKIASEVWKDADPHYKPAQLAREKLGTL